MYIKENLSSIKFKKVKKNFESFEPKNVCEKWAQEKQNFCPIVV